MLHWHVCVSTHKGVLDCMCQLLCSSYVFNCNPVNVGVRTQICARCVCVQLATKDCLPHFNPSPSTECIIHLFTRVMPNLYITANLAASVAGTARRAMAGACKYASL